VGTGYRVAVVGATGAVGQEMLAVLQKSGFMVRNRLEGSTYSVELDF